MKENNVVVTLDPTKFSEKKQKPLLIGGVRSIYPSILLFGELFPVSVSVINHDFPPDTKAFLYYFTPREKPRIAGELRLRVTQSDEPESFESGSDHLRKDGQPWSRLLYSLPKFYIPLYAKLREDKLVPTDLDEKLSALPTMRIRHDNSKFLYTLNDTFIVDFSKSTNLFVITEKALEMLPFPRLFYDARKGRGFPYKGAYANPHLSIVLY